MFEACIYSELHQVSCGPINFGFKYHFVGEKDRQSGPIGHIFFKMLDFTWVHFVTVFSTIEQDLKPELIGPPETC